MATTSPFDLVPPLAEALGIDDVIATRYGERDGAYDGTVDGFFVWGPGKLAAVREWAEGPRRRRRDELGLLRQHLRRAAALGGAPPRRGEPRPAAGHRRRAPALAAAAPRRARRRAEAGRRRAAAGASRCSPGRELFPWVRFDIDGTRAHPERGPAILVGNHRSYFDPLAVGYVAAQVGRPLRFLGKKEVFDAPVVGQLATALGGIRVERGTGSDEPLRPRPRRWRPARSWRSCRRARSRGAGRSSSPS